MPASLLLLIRRRRASLLSMAVVAAIVTAVGVGAPAAASAPSCATSGLVIWLNTEGNGTAGSIYYQLEFTNQSGHTCTLRGYPGVSAVDLSGHQLGSAASRNTVRAPHLVMLADGKTGVAVLRITEWVVLATNHDSVIRCRARIDVWSR